MSHYRISYEMIIMPSAMFSGFYINGGTYHVSHAFGHAFFLISNAR